MPTGKRKTFTDATAACRHAAARRTLESDEITSVPAAIMHSSAKKPLMAA
jgi:hypothetical protein